MAIKTVRATKHPLPQPMVRLVQGDSNTQVIRFLVKKEYGGINLYGLVWSVWVQGYEGEAEVSYIGTGTVSGDDIVLDWEVIPAATKAPGTTVLKLYGSNDGDGDTPRAWTSGNMIVNVTPTQMIDPGYDADEVAEIRQIVLDFGAKEAAFKRYTDNEVSAERERVDEDIASEKLARSTADSDIKRTQETLSARMDAFTTLQNGSTTGDAELSDIRIGADGISYANAGTSVRTQISNLSGKLTDIANEKTFTVNGTYSISYDVAAGETYTIENACGASVSIYTANASGSNIETVSSGLGNGQTISFTATQGATKLKGWTSGNGPMTVRCMSKRLPVLEGNVQTNTSKINDLYSICERAERGLDTVDATFVNGGLSSGAVYSSQSYRVASQTVIEYDRNIKLYIDSDYRIGVHTLNSDGSYVSDSGWKTGVYRIPANTRFRMQIAKVAETTGVVADIDSFVGKVLVGTEMYDGIQTKISDPFNYPMMSNGRVHIAIHRGLTATDAPENTLASFRKAGQSHCWGIETDINVTSDGHYVCIHDATLDRTTNGSGNVKDHTLSEIRSLSITGTTMAVPTFEEYLGICKAYSCVPVIELKTISALTDNTSMLAACSNIINTIRDYGFGKNVIMLVTAWTLPYVKAVDEDILCMIVEYSGNYESALNAISPYHAVGIDFEIGNSTDLSGNVVKTMHERGYVVGCWTVNNEQSVHEIFCIGVDFVTSDSVTSL